MSLNRLIHNELYKLFHRKSFLITMIIMLGLVILINYISSMSSKISYDNYMYSDQNIEYLNSEIKSLDSTKASDVERYVELQSSLDTINLVKKYPDGAWQRYIILVQGNILYQSYNTAKYVLKDDAVIASTKKKLDDFVATLDANDWKVFANQEKAGYEKTITETEAAIKATDDKSKLITLNQTLATTKINLEVINMRLDKNIPYGNSYLNTALSSYTSGKTQLLSYDMNNLSEEQKQSIKEANRTIAEAKFELDNNIDINDTQTANMKLKSVVTTFLYLYVIIGIMVASSMVSEEFNKGTIKQLLIRPFTRGKILFAKYLTCLIGLLFGILCVIACQYIMGGILYGFGTYGQPVVLYNYETSTLIQMSVLKYIGITFLGALPEILLLMTLSFSISTIMASTPSAVVIPILTLLFSAIINSLTIMYQLEYMKFFPTMCWDLNQFFFGNETSYKYDSLNLSIIMSSIYFIGMLIIDFIYFKKKDIKNI
jgi:ABC-2 type transport system permease protein